ncbi:mitochondrial-processing peptidase subunit beta-like [Pieris rapae]|uniref:mitochondrial-processing peptidase subunit beta-like n=1 Tax=Pieris rapae TaxID=64459 RepID=UPI001E27A819|nr:mitochondrial-processing peptidase subunit beta-like [Pieris rapae]
MFRKIYQRRTLLYHHTRKICKGPENVQTLELPNGLRVVTERIESPLACVNLFARVGSRYENYDTNGISHFIEHMAFRGFTSMDCETVACQVNNLEAKITSKTTREFQVFSAVCPSTFAGDIVGLLAKIVTELELSDQEMDCERNIIQQEMKWLDMNPKKVMFDYLHETAFQGTPLANRVIGPSRNVNKFNRDCACYFMRNHYTPTRLLFVAAGDVSSDTIAAAASRHVGSTECETKADFSPCRFTASQVRFRDDSMPFAHISLAFEAPGYKSLDYLPLLVAKNYFGSWHRSQGGSDRHASDAVRAVATDNLCEQLESFYIAHSDVGLWGVYFVVPNMNIENVIYNIQNMLMHLCCTITKNDVERAVNITKLELARRIDGVVNSAFDIGVQIMLKNERTPLQNIYQDLSRLDPKAIKAVAEACIYDKPLVTAAVGPTEELPDYNRLQAGQYWLRL